MDLKMEYKDTNVKHAVVITQKAHHMGYPIEVKKEALRYYLEGIGFRRIERLPGVSYTAVIYRVKKAGEKIKDIAFIEQKMDIVGSRAIFTKYKGFLCWG